MHLEEKCTSSRLIYDGRIVKLFEDEIELPNGAPAKREHIKHVGAVCVLPLTDDGNVVMERQFRYPFGKVLVEIPAGKLDGPNEDLLAAALRELREETGIVPQSMTYLGDFIGSPAILGEHVGMFLARGLSFCEQQLDEDEFLEVFTMPLGDAVEKVLSGEITDGKTQAAVLKTHIILQKEGKEV
ncbi:MAG: NUDIX hydrolase [Clostridia bacterium]|nr:NUDIX hydrolase [Clostridia bacterium]MBQ8717283.1 NUDIX hydrolase [Clostridia bacterium]